jgi:hypothetical protein
MVFSVDAETEAMRLCSEFTYADVRKYGVNLNGEESEMSEGIDCTPTQPERITWLPATGLQQKAVLYPLLAFAWYIEDRDDAGFAKYKRVKRRSREVVWPWLGFGCIHTDYGNMCFLMSANRGYIEERQVFLTSDIYIETDDKGVTTYRLPRAAPFGSMYLASPALII